MTSPAPMTRPPAPCPLALCAGVPEVHGDPERDEYRALRGRARCGADHTGDDSRRDQDEEDLDDRITRGAKHIWRTLRQRQRPAEGEDRQHREAEEDPVREHDV